MRPLLFCVLLACLVTNTAMAQGVPADHAPTDVEAQIVAADNAFTFRLFAEVVGDAADQNIFISPVSASMALSMVLTGARGETRAAMARALGKANLTAEQVQEGYRGLLGRLPHLDPKVTFVVGNAIWSRDEFRLAPTFVAANQRAFDAEIEALDFDDQVQAARVMNEWVHDKTQGRIGGIMSPEAITPDLLLVLANALYFKAQWSTAFDSTHTREEPFYVSARQEQPVMMMRQVREFPYHDGDGFAALDIPYGDGSYAMTVLLPDEGRSVNTLAAELDEKRWQALLDGMVPQEVVLKLPRLKMNYGMSLNAVLNRLGMGRAFSDGADFSGISPDDALKISTVKQATFVEMNEEGTEAVAATVINVKESVSNDRSQPVSFIVDRPYVIVIRERTTGAILFVGRILNPAA